MLHKAKPLSLKIKQPIYAFEFPLLIYRKVSKQDSWSKKFVHYLELRIRVCFHVSWRQQTTLTLFFLARVKDLKKSWAFAPA